MYENNLCKYFDNEIIIQTKIEQFEAYEIKIYMNISCMITCMKIMQIMVHVIFWTLVTGKWSIVVAHSMKQDGSDHTILQLAFAIVAAFVM